LVHFHEALGADLDLGQHVRLHPDVVVPVGPEQRAARTDTRPVVDADDLQLTSVLPAQFLLRSLFTRRRLPLVLLLGINCLGLRLSIHILLLLLLFGLLEGLFSQS
jgi:hypothetical protein